jgi:hypothetical protein
MLIFHSLMEVQTAHFTTINSSLSGGLT